MCVWCWKKINKMYQMYLRLLQLHSAGIHWHSPFTHTHTHTHTHICTYINLSPLHKWAFTFWQKPHHLNTDTHTPVSLSYLYCFHPSFVPPPPLFPPPSPPFFSPSNSPWAHFLFLFSPSQPTPPLSLLHSSSHHFSAPFLSPLILYIPSPLPPSRPSPTSIHLSLPFSLFHSSLILYIPSISQVFKDLTPAFLGSLVTSSSHVCVCACVCFYACKCVYTCTRLGFFFSSVCLYEHEYMSMCV